MCASVPPRRSSTPHHPAGCHSHVFHATYLQASARSGSAPAGGRRPRFVSSDLNGRSTTWREKVVFTLPQFSTGIMQLFHDYWLGYVGSVPVRQWCAHTSSPALHTPHESSAFYANEVQLDLGRIALVLSIYAGMHVLLNPVVGWLIDRYSRGTATRVWVEPQNTPWR